jgi:hypothetical protein
MKKVRTDLDYNLSHFQHFTNLAHATVQTTDDYSFSHTSGIKEILQQMSEKIPYIVNDMKSIRGLPVRILPSYSHQTCARRRRRHFLIWDEMRLFMQFSRKN